MPKATITCYCGSCSITLADGEATCLFQCGCNSCRQKIQFGQANGGRECSPLPKLVYVPSLIDAVDGQHFIWFPGPDLNRHGRNGRGILSSLHYGITQHNPR